ncbi:hypothetical protein B0H63DRAFT_511020 [Podospora didyma]|uniref:Uncharacterized protein n=1 Tax=Podospora didyma TaxID=330526 RepID=A0AAE0NGM0_9PEZI|nr:hypothetical protein B0H63DRAFT_511020 [Podospora didyma]
MPPTPPVPSARPVFSHGNVDLTSVNKPSLRILDDGGSMTREQDLVGGSLLAGLHANEPLVLDPEIISSALGDLSPDEPFIPHVRETPQIPLRAAATLPQVAMTESDLSTGRSMSVPETSAAALDHISPSACSTLVIDGADPDDTAEQLSAIASKTSSAHASPIFSWRHEFEWRDGSLLFSEETFSLRRTTSQSSDALSIAESERAVAAIVRSDLSVLESFDFTELNFLNPERYRKLKDPNVHKALGWLGDQLIDHFWRTYVPHNTKGRGSSTSARQSTQLGNASSQTRAGISKGRPTGPRRRTAPDEFEGSDIGGGDDGDNGEARWRPSYFSSCWHKLKTISHVKQHLNKKHRPKYCRRCFSVFDDSDGNNSSRKEEVARRVSTKLKRP